MPRTGILLFPDVEELDFAGPWEMAGMWAAVAEGPAPVGIGMTGTEPIRCRKGLRVVPDVAVDAAPDCRVLVVPGGEGSRAASENSDVLRLVKRHAEVADAVLSVCTGARILNAAGVLRGGTATTHWSALDEARSWDGVTVQEVRWTRTGRIWTAAGVSAGMDAMLALIAHLDGREAAARVQQRVEYFPDGARYGDIKDWPEAPGYVREEGEA